MLQHAKQSGGAPSFIGRQINAVHLIPQGGAAHDREPQECDEGGNGKDANNELADSAASGNAGDEDANER